MASSGDEHHRVELSDQRTAVIQVDRDHAEGHDSSTAVSAVKAAGRTGKQYYQPVNAYEYQQLAQRRAYNKGPNYSLKKRLKKIKYGRRPRPRRRPAGPQMLHKNRYRRLPTQPMRAQHVNYVDSAGGMDYEDGFESAPQSVSLDYGEHEFVHEPAMAYSSYGPTRSMAAAVPVAVIGAPSGRTRKRPAATGYVDVPLRVAFSRPTPPVVATTVATADPMDKLRQLVHEAMDAHFANKHQELYSDGFDKRHHQLVYSSKYKRPKDKSDKQQQQQQQMIDAVKATVTAVVPAATSPVTEKDVPSQDADADGSDDRLTLAEISAYMGAKPGETVLSAGGHRYVLSDAIQQSYRQQQQQQQQQLQQQQQQAHYGDENGQQRYLRYVSPFETLYEMPGTRWTYN